jgi:hypothetical protein
MTILVATFTFLYDTTLCLAHVASPEGVLLWPPRLSTIIEDFGQKKSMRTHDLPWRRSKRRGDETRYPYFSLS